MMVAGIVAMFIAFGAAVLWLVRRLQRSFADQHSIEVRYRNIASQLREAIVLVDGSSFELLEANDAARKALGCSRETLQTQNVQNLFPEITPAVLAEVVKDRADGTIHITRQRRDAEGWSDAEVNITCLDIQGRTVLTLVSHDVSHRKAAEERERDSRRQLAKIAQHDALTTLPNRLYLHARLPRILETIAVGGRLLALLYVDLDNFKNINDSLGHGQGDRLLQIVATRMKAAVSMHDLVARMGGDEFVVVAPLMPDNDAVDKLALRLRTAVSAPIALENATVTVTASLGIVIFPNDGSDVKTLLKHADIALYQAKEAGRDCHRFFSADMDLRVSEHLALEQALRHAVGTNQITMDYQPVIDLRTGQLSSLEALMRWRHPEREMIPPSQFIPVAEKSGLIVELGRQGLTRVIAQIRAWLDADVPIVPVAINVSPLQLERTDFAALVSELAGKAGIDPSWLRFEITESAVMKEPDRLVGTLQTLRDLGSQVLIDDFGTGYSSLSYLNRLPVDTVKIDRAFVRDLGANCPHTPIIDAVIDMARKLGLKTVAEGVETAEQAALLQEQGCDYAQGYFYSKPVSARQCRSLLRELERVRPLTETVMVRAIASG
jgi:diguanylate cyclase (GGDEF)-like protein/PAS domain S-box-containing protein